MREQVALHPPHAWRPPLPLAAPSQRLSLRCGTFRRADPGWPGLGPFGGLWVGWAAEPSWGAGGGGGAFWSFGSCNQPLPRAGLARPKPTTWPSNGEGGCLACEAHHGGRNDFRSSFAESPTLHPPCKAGPAEIMPLPLPPPTPLALSLPAVARGSCWHPRPLPGPARSPPLAACLGLAELARAPAAGGPLCRRKNGSCSGRFACVSPSPACGARPGPPALTPGSPSVRSALSQHDPARPLSDRIPHQRQLGGGQPPAGLHPLGEQ